MYLAGLQLAQKRKELSFEAAFRRNVSNVYLNRGQHDEALDTLGKVYANQEKYDDALISHQDALELFNRLRYPFG